MRLKQKITSTFKSIGQALLYLVKLLFLPIGLLNLFAGLFHEKGVEKGKLHWFANLRRLLVAPAQALFTFAKKTFLNGNASELLYLIPGLTIVSFFVFVGYQIHFNKGGIEQRYVNGARRSIINRQPDLAKKYFQRVIEKDNLSNDLIYTWAMILQMAGDVDQGTDLLARIASENSAGYPPAHSALAVQLASEVQQLEPDAASLSRLHWHLENSGEPTAAVEQAWATYFVAKSQPELAIRHLENAATKMPRLYLAFAELCHEHGFTKKRTDGLQNAKRVFSEKLLRNPLDQESRTLLSRVLLDLNEPAEAENTLLSGLRIYRNPQLEREICNFYVLRFDRASIAGGEVHKSAKLSTTQKFDILRRSLLICPEHMQTYSRLASLTIAPDSKSQLDLKADFISMVTGEQSSALAHACLGHVEAQAGNASEAEWHLEQAWGFDPEFGMVASRLAQAFVSNDVPDIEWALVLARQGVANSQNKKDFRLLLAEIHLNKRDYDAANVELLQLLQDGHHSARIHELLAASYNGLGNSEKALHHSTEASAALKNSGDEN